MRRRLLAVTRPARRVTDPACLERPAAGQAYRARLARISVRSRISVKWRAGSCRHSRAAFQSVNHDSSEATVAYLSRIFVVNDDSSAASSPAARPAGRTTRASRPEVDPEPAAEP